MNMYFWIEQLISSRMLAVIFLLAASCFQQHFSCFLRRFTTSALIEPYVKACAVWPRQSGPSVR